jgi:DNA-binding beta-propeller fold protein YncE
MSRMSRRIHWPACIAGLALFLHVPSALVAADVKTIAGTGQKGHSGDGGPATAARCDQPYGLVIGPDGGLYVCEITNHVIRRVDLKSGVISTVAGQPGKKGYAGDGGPATQALLDEPYEIRFDAAGNMVFVEMKNHIVRRVDSKTGVITTVAGTGEAGFSGDGGPAIKAMLKQPHSIVLDRDGHISICDIGNHRVRRVDAKTGVITTFAGTGEKKPTPDGAPIVGTPLNGPRALDYDGKDSLYLALREGNAVYRVDLSAGKYTHLAGTGKKGYSGDGGDARKAELSGPKGIALAPNGDVYLADTESHTIRVIRRKTGTIETVAGTGQLGDGPDGDPLKCRLARPHGVFVAADGKVYIGDSENHRVRLLVE